MKAEPKHDFASKLRQPSISPSVQGYVSWQKERRKAIAEGREAPDTPKGIFPFSINLDLTTACNYRCDHCIDIEILNTKNKYEYSSLISSLGNMIRGGLRSVILIGGGEPTLHPKFTDVVRFIKENGLQVAVVSNGSRCDKLFEIAPILDERDWIRLSLDSGTNDTFRRMHKPVKDVVLEDICSWVPKIRSVNPKLPVGFSFIVTWTGASQEGTSIVSNIEEMVLATKLAWENRFNYISFKPFLTRHPDGSEVLDPAAIDDFNQALRKIRQGIDNARYYETGDFKVLESTNLRALMDGSWKELTRQPQNCHMQAFRQVLSPLGLYNCPAYRGSEKARISDKNSYLNEATITETQRKVASIIDSFDASIECKNITCLYNSANWFIEEAISREEEIKEFSEERRDYYF